MMIAEEQEALRQLQEAIRPIASEMVDQVAFGLAGTPADQLDRELRNIGHVLWKIMQVRVPNMSPAMQVVLPYAFIEMVRERICLMHASIVASC